MLSVPYLDCRGQWSPTGGPKIGDRWSRWLQCHCWGGQAGKQSLSLLPMDQGTAPLEQHKSQPMASSSVTSAGLNQPFGPRWACPEGEGAEKAAQLRWMSILVILPDACRGRPHSSARCSTCPTRLLTDPHPILLPSHSLRVQHFLGHSMPSYWSGYSCHSLSLFCLP